MRDGDCRRVRRQTCGKDLRRLRRGAADIRPFARKAADADHLGVRFVAENDDGGVRPGRGNDLVDFSNIGTGRVGTGIPAGGKPLVGLPFHAVRADEDVCVGGERVQFGFGKDAYTLLTHRVVELPVVDDFAQTVNALAPVRRRLLEQRDGPPHAGAE